MYQIIEDSSTVAYDEYCQSRKRARSVKEEVDDGGNEPAFDYTVMKDQPPAQNYVCYPNGQPAWTCHPQPQPACPPLACPQPICPQPVQVEAYQQPAGYQQYACYNSGYPFPGPTVCAPTPYQIPGLTCVPAVEAVAEPQCNNLWLGRTKAQVDEDNVKIAMRENVYKYDPMKPAGAASDQLFWVVELDGRTTLRDFRTIDEDLQPGRWERDPRYDNAYFIREEKPKKDVKKAD